MNRDRFLALAAFLVPFLVFLAGPYLGSGDTEPAELLPISSSKRTPRLRPLLRCAAGPSVRLTAASAVTSSPLIRSPPVSPNVPVLRGRAVGGRRPVRSAGIRSRTSPPTSSPRSPSCSSFWRFSAAWPHGRRVSSSSRCSMRSRRRCGPSRAADSGSTDRRSFSLRLVLAASLRRSAARRPGRTDARARGRQPADGRAHRRPAAPRSCSRAAGRVPAFAAWAAVPAAAVTIYSASVLGNPFAFGQLYRSGGFGGRILPGLAGILGEPLARTLRVQPGSPRGDRRDSGRRCARVGTARRFFAGSPPAPPRSSCSTSAWGMWWGGASFGYRIVLDVVPVLVLLAAFPPRSVRGVAAGPRRASSRCSPLSALRRGPRGRRVPDALRRGARSRAGAALGRPRFRARPRDEKASAGRGRRPSLRRCRPSGGRRSRTTDRSRVARR